MHQHNGGPIMSYSKMEGQNEAIIVSMKCDMKLGVTPLFEEVKEVVRFFIQKWKKMSPYLRKDLRRRIQNFLFLFLFFSFFLSEKWQT